MRKKESELLVSVPVKDVSKDFYLHQEYATFKTPDGKECQVVITLPTYCPVIEFDDGRRFLIDTPALISRIAEQLY